MTTTGRDGVIVRPAVAADVPEIAEMVEEFEEYLNRLANPGDILAQIEPPQLTGDALRRDGFGADPWFAGLMADRNGAPVGYLLYHFGYWAENAARSLVVADLFVREAARGHGVGTALMTEATRILRRRGGQVIMWTVWDRNPSAIAFYQRLGVTTVSEEIIMKWPENAWPAG